MKTIPLTQGQVAKVADEWFEVLNKFKWYARYDPHTKSFYAVRTPTGLLGKQKNILMHRVIANTPDGMKCDHRDHDTLNNLPDNLRNCTHAQNRQNSRRDIDNRSGFKGVHANNNNWQARIRVNNKLICLGTYKTREEAAHVYDQAAIKYFGEFANLNFHD